MSTDPTHITIAQLRAAYDALGLDPELFNSTRRIELTPHNVTAIRYQRDDEGHTFLGEDGQPATVSFVAEIA